MEISDKINIDIVPWALPNEEIPFSVTFHNDLKFSKIVIKLGEGLEFVKLVNILEYNIYSSELNVNKLKQVNNGINYFGASIAFTKIPNELKLSKDVTISFYTGILKEEKIYEKKIQARIFRPRLEIIDYPPIIHITNEEKKIPIVMKYSGFGDVTMQIIGRKLGGKIITKGEQTCNKNFRLPDPIEYERPLEMHFPDLGESLARSFFKNFPIDALSNLINFAENSPIENVKLVYNQTLVEVYNIENLEIIMLYSDSIGNTYYTLPILILIHKDLPNDMESSLIPIEVKEWKSEPIINAKEIKI